MLSIRFSFLQINIQYNAALPAAAPLKAYCIAASLYRPYNAPYYPSHSSIAHFTVSLNSASLVVFAATVMTSGCYRLPKMQHHHFSLLQDELFAGTHKP